MKRNRLCLLLAIVLVLLTAGCSNKKAGASQNTIPRAQAKIFLYGEEHSIDAVIEKEYELWYEHYHEDGMRHLFLESPYYSCEFLNLWMQEESDELLDALFDDLEGTAVEYPAYKEFYKKIKANCPETIFHGTDVGHQYDTTGERYLAYLVQQNLEESEQYARAREVIEQGQYFYGNSGNPDHVYRENKMTENFIWAFDALNGEKIMGIYGGSHTGLEAMDFFGKVPCMANQLKQHYGDIIYSEYLSGK